jgi:methionyl aminopeptidase
MSINGPEEWEGMGATGAVVRLVLEAMKREVRPRITTEQLDEAGSQVMKEHGAQSAPAAVYKFPGANCISLNDEAVHGIPGNRALQQGDLVKLDVTVEKDRFMADAAVTVPVGEVTEERQRLVACAERVRQGYVGSTGRFPHLGDWKSDRTRGPAQVVSQFFAI